MSNLTPAQRKHLARLARWPFRLWCPTERYNAIYDGYEQANRQAAEDARQAAERAAAEAIAQREQAAADAEMNRQRSYYEILNRVTTYDGPDYRVKLAGQDNWIRASERQYEQAAQVGVQRSIGIPAPEPMYAGTL